MQGFYINQVWQSNYGRIKQDVALCQCYKNKILLSVIWFFTVYCTIPKTLSFHSNLEVIHLYEPRVQGTWLEKTLGAIAELSILGRLCFLFPLVTTIFTPMMLASVEVRNFVCLFGCFFAMTRNVFEI